MVVRRVASSEEYLSALDPKDRPAFGRLLELARENLPGFSEAIRYGMVHFQGPEGQGLGIARQVRHFSLYFGEPVLARHRRDLHGRDVGRSCVRFPGADSIDWPLVESLLRTAGRQAASGSG